MGMFGCEKVIGKGKNMSKKMILYLDAIEEGKKEEEEKIESTKIMFGSRKVLKKEKNMLKKIIFYFILFTMFDFIVKNTGEYKI